MSANILNHMWFVSLLSQVKIVTYIEHLRVICVTSQMPFGAEFASSYKRRVKILNDLVRSTAIHAIHLQFDISANALEIRVVEIP
jgi:hypothetical protein